MQEYFEKERNATEFLTESDLASICLTCMSTVLGSLTNGITKTVWSFPLLKYAHIGWHKHLKNSTEQRVAQQCAELLLDSKKLEFILQILESTQDVWNRWIFGGETALHLAGHFGLSVVVKIIFEKWNTDTPNGE